MTKTNNLLHIDFKTYSVANKFYTKLLGGVLLVLLFIIFVPLFASFGLNNHSHFVVILTLLMLAVTLPSVLKDTFGDSMEWPRYASNIVQSQEPIDVDLHYGFAAINYSSSDYDDGQDAFYLKIAGYRVSKGELHTYRIVYPQKSVISFASRFPELHDTEAINEQKKNLVRAQAYTDPNTNNAVMIEHGELRMWVQRVL